jgi:beta-glucanase (GH16 family)
MRTTAILATLFAAAPCLHADGAGDFSPQVPAVVRDGYSLVWRDEFDGAKLDETKWRYRGDGSVRKLGRVARGTVSLDGKGHCLIRVQRDGKGGYLIGQIATQGIFAQTYGYYECRAEMNRSLGPHVAFWLQSDSLGKTGDPARDGTEIDIFEYHRKQPGTVFHNLHWDGYGEKHKSHGHKIALPEIGSGFHTFGLLWTAEEYVFFVNGRETWRTSKALSRRDQYVILSAELSGWGGNPAEGTFPDEVRFDYVRVYQKK